MEGDGLNVASRRKGSANRAVTVKESLTTARKAIGVIYHFICMLLYVGINVYDKKIENECPQPTVFYPGASSFGGRGKYLTHINLVALSIYFCIAFVNDLMANTSLHKMLTTFNDWFFTTVVWPLSLAVFILFWGIYAIDRELVYPEYLDQYIPYHLNHMWHTVMLPIVILEMLFVFHHHSSNRVAVGTIVVFSIAYVTWTYIIYVVDGKWPYPFQKNLGAIGFGLFATTCALFTGILYWLGRVISFKIWTE